MCARMQVSSISSKLVEMARREGQRDTSRREMTAQVGAGEGVGMVAACPHPI